jgi:Trp operon repressor
MRGRRPTIDLLKATYDLVERDVKLGLVEPTQLRFTIEARKKAAIELAAKGMSQRQIAKVTGAGLGTINRDLHVPDGTESVPNGTPAKREAALREQLKIAQTPAVMPSSRYDTVVIDPPMAYP